MNPSLLPSELLRPEGVPRREKKRDTAPNLMIRALGFEVKRRRQRPRVACREARRTVLSVFYRRPRRVLLPCRFFPRKARDLATISLRPSSFRRTLMPTLLHIDSSPRAGIRLGPTRRLFRRQVASATPRRDNRPPQHLAREYPLSRRSRHRRILHSGRIAHPRAKARPCLL